jgi:pyridoxal phosphate enzyme (YggS family)
MSEAFEAQLAQIQARIDAAAQRSGRRGDEITLVAVTKTHPDVAVQAAYAAGLRDFGESRVEALAERAALPVAGARWHMIGQLQSRKVRDVAGQVSLIHSVDRLAVAQELEKRMPPHDSSLGTDAPRQDVLLQVNVSGEASKAGWHATTDAETETFLAEVAQVLALPRLRVRGFMTMAPYEEDVEKTRPFFTRLRIVQQTVQAAFPNSAMPLLSMGMTNDYDIAIEEGATHVRIGTALFGERLYYT